MRTTKFFEVTPVWSHETVSLVVQNAPKTCSEKSNKVENTLKSITEVNGPAKVLCDTLKTKED